MTRGRLMLYTNEGFYSSTEFNGDMYFEGGYGDDAMAAIRDIRTVEELKKATIAFNEKHHRYRDIEDDEWVYCIDHKPNGTIVAEEYFYVRWTDYVFIKNATDKPVHIVPSSGDDFDIPAYCSTPLSFGCHYDKRYNELCVPELYVAGYPESAPLGEMTLKDIDEEIERLKSLKSRMQEKEVAKVLENATNNVGRCFSIGQRVGRIIGIPKTKDVSALGQNPYPTLDIAMDTDGNIIPFSEGHIHMSHDLFPVQAEEISEEEFKKEFDKAVKQLWKNINKKS